MAQDYYAVIAHPDAFKNTASPTAPVQIGLGPQTTQGYPLGVGTTPPFSVPRWIYFQPEHQSMFIGMNAGGSGAGGVLTDGEGNTIIGNNAGVSMNAGGTGDNTCLGANNFYSMTGTATAMTITAAPPNSTYSQAATSPYITLKVDGVSVFEITDVNTFFSSAASQIEALSGWECTAGAGANAWYVVANITGQGIVQTDVPITTPFIVKAGRLGGYNTAIGVDSQVNLTTGDGNTSVGKLTLYSNATGIGNCAFGRNALNAYLGSSACAFGWEAGYSATTATFFNAFGYNALRNLTTGEANCAFGTTALRALVTGTNNCGIGIGAGDATLGNENTLVGNNAGLYQSTVNGTTAIGYLAHGGTDIAGDAFNIIGPSGVAASYSFDGTTITLKEDAVTVGTFTAASYATYQLLIDAIVAAHPTWFPSILTWWFTSPTNGVVYVDKDVSHPNDYLKGRIRTKLNGHNSYNVAIGQNAMRAATGTNNVAIGAQTLYDANSIGSDNVCIGVSAGYALTLGYSNILIGSNAGGAQTTGYENVGIGSSALGVMQTGYQNTAIGFDSMRALVSGYLNTAIGYYSGRGATGNNNTIVGATAMQAANCTGSDNTALGTSAGFSVTSGQQNIFVGSNAGAAITTGSYNTVSGYLACQTATTASYNAAYGYHALRQSSGSYNVAIGASSLSHASNTASNNVAIGASTGAELTTGTRNVMIGNNQGNNITTGSGNVMVGASTLVIGADITGSSNILVGDDIDLEDRTASNQINIGTRYYHDRLRLAERSADPAQPTEGNFVLWLSDGTGLGDDGDVMIASTAGGVTNYTTLFDHSAGTVWP